MSFDRFLILSIYVTFSLMKTLEKYLYGNTFTQVFCASSQPSDRYALFLRSAEEQNGLRSLRLYDKQTFFNRTIIDLFDRLCDHKTLHQTFSSSLCHTVKFRFKFF